MNKKTEELFKICKELIRQLSYEHDIFEINIVSKSNVLKIQYKDADMLMMITYRGSLGKVLTDGESSDITVFGIDLDEVITKCHKVLITAARLSLELKRKKLETYFNTETKKYNLLQQLCDRDIV